MESELKAMFWFLLITAGRCYVTNMTQHKWLWDKWSKCVSDKRHAVNELKVETSTNERCALRMGLPHQVLGAN